MEVSDAATLVDPSRTGTAYSVGRQTLGEAISVQPSRSLSDQVDDLPGWLYEANGILHPRGSEYDVQYVIDGVPVTENRSPAFAPSLDADAVESMRVLTANYPAEYGRKLGGIIEVTTEKNVPSGWHGEFDLGGGSFGTADGSLALSYSHAKDRLSVSGNGLYTDRYLDPPVLANYTNRANANGVSASYERDFSDLSRLRVSISHNEVRYLVPNELVQQQAGQRQDVANIETGGEIYFQRVISPNLVLSLAGSVRDSSATLASNPLSTPVIVSQDRGYREGYGRADLAGHRGRHEWKIGADTMANPVREYLQYTITDPTQFDDGTPLQFQFSDRRWDVEPSAYAQDQIRLGNWNVSAGLRFDHYAFVVRESAWSPRLGVSRYVPALNLLLHASYDRVFQTPALENLLLASSPEVDSMNPIVLRLPVCRRGPIFMSVELRNPFGEACGSMRTCSAATFATTLTMMFCWIRGELPDRLRQRANHRGRVANRRPALGPLLRLPELCHSNGRWPGTDYGRALSWKRCHQWTERHESLPREPGPAQYGQGAGAFPGQWPGVAGGRWRVRQRIAGRHRWSRSGFSAGSIRPGHFE